MIVSVLIISNPKAPRNTNASEINPLKPGRPIAAKNATVVKPA